METPRKPRRAKLEIKGLSYGEGHQQWCRLTHRNGEIALAGEGVSNPKRARSAIIRAMIDVLEDEGYVVTKPEEAGR